MPLTQNDLDWFAARLSIAVYETNREYRMGALTDLKAELGNIPGIDTLSVSFGGGMQHITINSQTISVGVNASVDEIRKALGLSPMSDTNTTALPQVQIDPSAASQTAAPTTSTQAMSVTGAAHAGLSLKQMLQDRKAKIAAAHDKLSSNFDKLDQATAALDNLGSKVGAEADDLLAVVGQFTNDLG